MVEELFSDVQCTPEERLKELQQLYNSQELKAYTTEWKLRMDAWYKEMVELVKLHPELAQVKLNTYASHGVN